MQVSFNNTSFGNTFYLYRQGLKSNKKIDTLVENVQRAPNTDVLSVGCAYKHAYDLTPLNEFPHYSCFGMLPIDGIKAKSKEVIVTKDNPALDKAIKTYCEDNEITYREVEDDKIQELILANIQLPEKLDSRFYEIVRVNLERLEAYIEEDEGNFKEVLYAASKDTNNNKTFKMFARSNCGIEAPMIYFQKNEEDGSLNLNLSRAPYFYGGSLYNKNHAKRPKINHGDFLESGTRYSPAQVYLMFKEMGLTEIPVTVTLKTKRILQEKGILAQ